ncbi:MAG TPA: hypothetical protein VFP94_05160 [Terriglobales bacterium]|nr:hypothetical protein [Terriglobales bacterium]
MPAPDSSSPSASRFEEAARRIEAEVKRLVNNLNDEVVPALRRDGGKALRVVADKMAQLADNLDRSR